MKVILNEEGQGKKGRDRQCEAMAMPANLLFPKKLATKSGRGQPERGEDRGGRQKAPPGCERSRKPSSWAKSWKRRNWPSRVSAEETLLFGSIIRRRKLPMP